MPTEKISFEAFEDYETFSFKTIEDQELFDEYYDTIIEPKIISFLVENGYPIDTVTDEDYEDENIEYDDSWILQQSSFKIENQTLVNQYDISIKQEIDDSTRARKITPFLILLCGKNKTLAMCVRTLFHRILV